MNSGNYSSGCCISPAEDIAAVKVVIRICNNLELKREILCASDEMDKQSRQYYRKKQWDKILETKAAGLLKNLGLPEKLHEKLQGLVLSVGMSMLTWAEYHEGTVGFSREYSIHFLNSSFFTQRGTIDNKKAAEGLIKGESLNIQQKYKLACLYCFTDHIYALYRQIAKEDKDYSTIPQWPGLVKFWTYYLMGEVDKIKGEKTIDRYRLEKAIESGSKAAVEYCLEGTQLRTEKEAVVDAAMEAVKNTIIRYDWIVFRDQRYDGSKESWVPSDYYMNILCFLLSKMRDDDRIEFLKKDIGRVTFNEEFFEDPIRSKVLEYFLNWPYQDYFMKTAGQMWTFLPESNYAVLLLKICDKIESEDGTLKYGEGKSYDYTKLLVEFFKQSPEKYKRYVFSNQKVVYEQEVTYESNRIVKLKAGVGLLIKLLSLKNFTYKDRQNINLILADVNDEEKENIISSEEGKYICIKLMKEEKWEILNGFVSNFFPSKEQAGEFKIELSLKEEAQRVYIDFIRNGKWAAAESFIKWSSFPEEEIIRLKREVISSGDGKRACNDLFLFKGGVESANKFCDWCFSSGEEIREFKKELIFSVGMGSCADLAIKDKLELVDEFIDWCLSSEKEIVKFKKDLASRMGSSVCENLISDFSTKDIGDEQDFYMIGRITKFKGGKWEEVEKFLTWCFSSEEEIGDFKKNRLLEMSGARIHLNLIKSNQWEEAETFFAWLGLSSKEIKELKKKTLFDAGCTMFSDLMYSVDGDGQFSDYGSRKEAIELFLRWYLTDKETVLEFKDHFKQRYDGEEITGKDRRALEDFDLSIEQRLKDLSEEQKGIKRKSEIVMPSKRFAM